ncbi:MAG: F-box protein [Kistimonas sp.]|nr:F-box protein [Kistimonas sp.]
MDTLSDSRWTHRHAARPQTGAGHRMPARHPGQVPGQPAVGRSVAQAAMSGEPALPGNECAALADSQAPTETPGIAQRLPDLVLRRIFSYLSPAAQCRCARVCRHWESCLPALRVRLTRWLKEEHPASYQAPPGWGQGFHSRTRPFLQATNSPLLPALMQQEQQEPGRTRSQDTGQLTGKPAAGDLFSALVHHSLQHQLTLTPQLRLRPAAITLPDKAPMHTFRFSACSRWLAMRCRPQATGPDVLRLYGWDKDCWQPCLLRSCPTENVSSFHFSLTPPDRLISVHGRDVLAWRKEQDSNTWHSTPVCQIHPAHRVSNLYSAANGDQVIMTKRAGDDFILLGILFCRPTSCRPTICRPIMAGESQGWETVMTTTYDSARVPFVSACWTMEPHSCQLALATVTHELDSGRFTNEVHIWHTGPHRARPQQWRCQTSVLPWYDAAIKSLIYSPGGRYLLGILRNGRGCLWALGAQCRLQERLILPGCLPPWRPHYPASFSADEQQLALPLSLRQIQLCYSDTRGNWRRYQVLEAPSAPADRPDREPHRILLSASGAILVRATPDTLDIWHRQAAGHWLHSLQRRGTENATFPTDACLLKAGELVCTTAQDPTLSLGVHGPDKRGRLVTKACRAVAVPLCGPDAISPDGLSLVVSSTMDPPCLLQIVPPEESEASRQTPAKHSGTCRLL